MEDILSIDPTTLSIGQRHGYLLSAIGPRPIALASTIDAEGNVNLSPYSFFNAFSTNPPILIFSPARRGRDNTTKHSYENVNEIKEVVINIVDHSMVHQMSLSSTEYPKGVNEFVKSGFTQIPSTKVRPPRVGESPVSFECIVKEVVPLGNVGASGNLVISEVIQIHIQKKFLDEQGKLDTTKLDLVGRMGGMWYCRASGSALFEVEKPGAEMGIGVDKLPSHVLASHVLTGNDLGRLGGLSDLPTEEDIIKMKEVHQFADWHGDIRDAEELRDSVHHKAKEMIESGLVKEALTLLHCI